MPTDASDGVPKAAPQPSRVDSDGFLALTDDTYYRTDAEGRLVFVSPAATDLFGYAGQELIGQPLSDYYVDPNGRADFLRQLKDNGGRLSGYEAALRHRDGHEVWVSTSSHFWFDEDGEVAGVEGLARDITERKKAAEALKKSEARLVEAQHIAQLGYWDRDLITNELWWSAETYSILGSKPVNQPVSFEPYLAAIHPDDQDRAREARERAIDGSEDYGLDHRIIRPDGEERFVHVEGQVSRDGAGRPVRFSGTCQDITDRKRIEDELRRSRDDLELRVKERTEHLEQQIAKTEAAQAIALEISERLRGIMSTAVDGIITIDAQGVVETFNTAAMNMFGYKAEDVVGKKINMLMPEPHQQQHDKYLNDYLDGGEAEIIGVGREVEGLRKDGSTFPMDLAVSELRFEDKTIFTGIVRDISERVKTQESLRESEQRFKDIAASASDWFWETDAEGRFTSISHRNGGKYKQEQQRQVIGKRRVEIADPEEVESAPEKWRHFEQTLAEHKPFRDFTYRRIAADGSKRYSRASGNPFFDTDGSFLGYRGATTDITDWIESENRAAQAQRRLKDALEGIADPIMILDAEDRIVLCNKAGRDNVKERIDVLVPGTPYEDFLRAFAESGTVQGTKDNPEKYVRERLAQHRDNYVDPILHERENDKWDFVREYRTSDGGTVIVRSDITELRQAESSAVLARIAAEKANQSKSEFLSSMSHELRTPMNAILGFGQLLNASQTSLSSKQRAYVQRILDGGEHLLSLINQVLELSKIEAGKADLSIREVSTEIVLDECLSLSQTDAAERDVTIERGYEGQTLPILRTDAMRLKQILVNLLSNAVKYNRPGGAVIVTCETISDEMLRIDIADTGHGIPAAMQDEVFEPFSRLGRESGNIEGTGIGLTVTKQLVELLGGTIHFRSEEGVGTTFGIEIPSHKGEVSDTVKLELVVDQDRRREGQERNTSNILYVEDNLASAQLMEEIVKQTFNEATELTIAFDAEDGLVLAKKQHPDLILMDLNLPGMDGFDALKSLRQCEKTRQTPVIALTADAMPDQIERGIEAGFYAYLIKPVNVAEVQRVIRSAWASIQPPEPGAPSN